MSKMNHQSYFNKRCLIIPLALVISLVQGTGFLCAQSANRRSEKPGKEKGLTVETAFKPAFFCTPAVNRIEARKGQTINFEFALKPVREAVRVSVRPVALKQDETGALKADLESPPPAEIRLNGRGEYDLPLGEEIKLTGRIKLPNNDSDFHSFGILVQDNGYLADERGQSDESTYGVKFVSQYILRCDVKITNGRGTDIKKLQVESAELVEVNGVPSASVMVVNPTRSTIEFEMQAKLTRAGYIEAKKDVKLFSRINANDNPPQRFITRIFPETRLEMVAGWPDAVFPGDYEMTTKITRNRSTIVETSTPLTIGTDDFPAQSAFAAEVGRGLHAHPAQILLSRQRGAKRFIPLNLTNFSTEPVEVDLHAIDLEGQPVDWLLIRPEQVTLNPGENRKSMVSLKAISDRQNHRVAFIEFVDPTSNSSEHVKIPVAYQGSGPFVPKLATNVLRIDYEIEGGAFVVDSLNQSELPLPIDASIRFKSSNGNTQTARAGYGKWLLPGEQRRLEFKINSSIAEGELPVELTFVDVQGNILAQREFVLNVESQFEEVANQDDPAGKTNLIK